MRAMLASFPGYSLTETLLSDADYVLCRGTREADDQPVLIRARTVDSDRVAARLRREYDILSHLGVDSVLRPLGFENYRGRSAVVFKNFGGRSLIDLIGSQPMAVSGAR